MNYDEFESGMEITIGVRCQTCDDGYLNLPTRKAEIAKECAESMGWVFVPGSGWECPKCWADWF